MRLRRPDRSLLFYLGSEFIDAVGTGLLTPLVILYLTRILAFAPVTAGAVLTLGAASAVAATPLGGVMLDRIDARHLTATCFATAAAGYLMLGFATTLLPLLVVIALIQAAEHAAKPAVQSIAFALREGGARMKLLAWSRSIRYLGYSIGAVGAAGAAAIDTRRAYGAVLIVDAISFLVAAGLIERLPPTSPPPRDEQSQPSYRAVLRDRAYMTLLCIATCMWLNVTLLDIGVALWVVRAVRSVSPGIVGLLFALNCILIVALQVQFSRRSETLLHASRLFLISGLTLAVSCFFFAGANRAPAVIAVCALVGGVTLLTMGEITLAAAQWAPVAALAPPHLRGRYLTMISFGQALQQMLGPLIVTSLLVSSGRAAWLGFGFGFLLLGISANAVARRAAIQRERFRGGFSF